MICALSQGIDVYREQDLDALVWGAMTAASKCAFSTAAFRIDAVAYLWEADSYVVDHMQESVEEVWPAELGDQWRNICLKTQQQMHAVGCKILTGLALALGWDAELFGQVRVALSTALLENGARQSDVKLNPQLCNAAPRL